MCQFSDGGIAQCCWEFQILIESRRKSWKESDSYHYYHQAGREKIFLIFGFKDAWNTEAVVSLSIILRAHKDAQRFLDLCEESIDSKLFYNKNRVERSGAEQSTSESF